MYNNNNNKHYYNKHNSLMFNGYYNKTLYNYRNNTILNRETIQRLNPNSTQHNNEYSVVVNTGNNSTRLGRNTDIKSKYFGYTKPDTSCGCTKNKQQNNIEKKQEKVKKIEIVKELPTKLSFDKWQSQTDLLDQIKNLEDKINNLKINMENKEKKIVIDKNNGEKNNNQKEIYKPIKLKLKNFITENTKTVNHPFRDPVKNKVYVEGEKIQVTWAPNKWVDGTIDEVTIGGLYYVRHLTERENNINAEMTWTRSLVNPNQIRRKN